MGLRLRFIGFFLLALLLAIAAIWLYQKTDEDQRVAVQLERFQQALKKKENVVFAELQQIHREWEESSLDTFFIEQAEQYEGDFEKHGLAFLAYEKDTLIFWSDNAIPLPPIDLLGKNKSLHHLANGWYEAVVLEREDKKFVGLILIQTDYTNENRYLINALQDDFNCNCPAAISKSAQTGYQEVLTAEGNQLLFVHFNCTETKNSAIDIWLLMLMILSGFFLLRALHLSSQMQNHALWRSLLFIALLVVLRAVMIYWNWPSVLYRFYLFDPVLYASSTLFPSLGDLLLNALLLFYLSFFWYRRKAILLPSANRPFKKNFIFLLLLGIVLGYGTFITIRFKNLVADSNLQFDLSNIADISYYSIVGLTSIALLFASFYQLVLLFFYWSQKQLCYKNSRFFWLGFLALALVYLLANDWVGLVDFWIISWPIVILLMLSWMHLRQTTNSFARVLLILVTFSASSAYTLIKYSNVKEKRARVVLAEKLLEEEDPVAEFLYPSTEEKLLADTLLKRLFSSDTSISFPAFQTYIKGNYFSGYWAKYQVHPYAFNKSGLWPGARNKTEGRSFRELEEIIRESSSAVSTSSHLYLVTDSRERLNYLIRIPYRLEPRSSIVGFVFLEVVAKFRQEVVGFPDLLLDASVKSRHGLQNYSYARYHRSILVEQAGAYQYPRTPEVYEDSSMLSFSTIAGFHHLILKGDALNTLLLSKPEISPLQKATVFSYLFVFFSVCLLVGLLLQRLLVKEDGANLQLKTKIQFLMASFIFCALVLFGLGSTYYLTEQYEEKNKRLIEEKVNSVLIELQQKLSSLPALDRKNQRYITNLLKKFSNVFFTDISLYDQDGSLLATSREEVFRRGLLSEKMNAKAYAEVSLQKKSKFIHTEKLGRLSYLSAYVPFTDPSGEVLAYLNLPYFAKQNELENEISNFLLAIGNALVLLLALSIVAALFVSNWVTKPLKAVQEGLARMELGKTNQLIAYKGSDEIAALIIQYNAKVKELESKAELLAKSEREYAWREMAKQVAHEIKNPLTPIKLTVQQLERAWKDGAEDLQERFEKFTQTIVGQIDTLSNIADEFSSFAQMPKPQMEQVDLMRVLEASTGLFSNVPNVSVLLQNHSGENPQIMGDKNQLIRVFNNLIQNGIQSIQKGQNGELKVLLTKSSDRFLVEVRDNGEGIAVDQLDRIFVPNFTTKRKGMGLGLAMVKRSVESARGSVWFETKAGEGTSFFVSFPALKPV